MRYLVRTSLPLVLAITSLSLRAQGSLLQDIRRDMSAVFADEDLCDAYIARFKEEGTSGSALLLGYSGALRMAKGKHAFDPISKMIHFGAGKDLLEEAIAQDPTNVELRFLRLTIQVNVPRFMNYSDDREADLAIVEGKLPDVKDPVIHERIERFIAKNKAEGKL